MRWYVSKNAETSGPVDEKQVVEWVQAGLRDCMVRDEAGGPWTPLALSPFAPRTAPSSPMNWRRVVVVLGALAVALLAGNYVYANITGHAFWGEKTSVYVECFGAGSMGYTCTATHKSGSVGADVCWDLVISCRNGTAATGHACSRVEQGGKTSAGIPLSEVANAEACDAAVGARVANIRVTEVR
jgi:hypothetical protein